MNVTPINNNIIFTFVDRVNSKGEFEQDSTPAGILLNASFDDSAKSPRWVNVVAVGSKCTAIKPGDQVLLPNLRWTSHIKFDDKKLWRSDESQAVAVRDHAEAEIRPLSTYVLFEETRVESVRASGLILVVGASDETPSGTVAHVGPDVAGELAVGAKIFYNDTNFTDRFVHNGRNLSFIKDESILAYEAPGE